MNKLLLLPAKKGAPTTKQQKLISTLEDIVDGKVTSKNQKFYLKTKGIGEIEMGLLAEGYRKLATLLQLISNGVLSENSILFWDEPETNINPKMIPSLKNLLVALSEMGVQIFITTHSYFLQQELSLFAQYQNKDALDIQFTTLYFDEERNIRHESKPLTQTHNLPT